MSDPAGVLPPAARLFRLLGGKWIAAAISAAASLGIPDVLASGPMSLEVLARRIDCEPSALERLLRVLQGEDLIRTTRGGEYELTEMGATMQSGQLGDLARLVGAPFSWDPWSALPSAVRTGKAAFETRHGAALFDYLEQDDRTDEAALYHAAIDSFTRAESRALVDAFGWERARCVADLGGGRGALLVDLLQAHPHLEGVLFERPAAVAEAQENFESSGIASRCRAEVGDFFEALPKQADVCVLKHIVHSWDDEVSARLLRRCADLVGAEGYVLVIEGLLLPGGRSNLTSLLDLEMLVLCGEGHERSKPAMRRLLTSAGLRLEKTLPLAESAYLFVTRPA